MQGLKFCHLFVFSRKLPACCDYNHLLTVETFTSPGVYIFNHLLALSISYHVEVDDFHETYGPWS